MSLQQPSMQSLRKKWFADKAEQREALKNNTGRFEIEYKDEVGYDVASEYASGFYDGWDELQAKLLQLSRSSWTDEEEARCKNEYEHRNRYELLSKNRMGLYIMGSYNQYLRDALVVQAHKDRIQELEAICKDYLQISEALSQCRHEIKNMQAGELRRREELEEAIARGNESRANWLKSVKLEKVFQKCKEQRDKWHIAYISKVGDTSGSVQDDAELEAIWNGKA